MVLRFYPSKDATIYERYPTKNTGLDSILELSKQIVLSASAYHQYNSRILLDFDYNSISQSIVQMGYNPNAFDYKLKLYATRAEEIPLDYTLYCYPVSQSWSMGVGRIVNNPITTQGVSWTYRTGAALTSSAWATSSFNPLTTGSWRVVPGGGTWYTSSVSTQSFSYSTTDVVFDINQIIDQVQAGTIPFSGFVIKKSDEDEASNLSFNSLQFFSKDTSTVFIPTIEASYNDSSFTGSLPAVNIEDEFNVVMTNLQPSYSELSTPTIRFAARPRYPSLTFSTSSVYLNRCILSGSQYSIRSAQSDDVVVDFSEYTTISVDGNGNLFKLHMNSLQPERYYKIVLKVPYSGSTNHQIIDGDFIFKVTRS